MAQALLAGADVLKCVYICWENIILHSHPEIEILFKFIPKILMSKECIHFFWATLYGSLLCAEVSDVITRNLSVMWQLYKCPYRRFALL